MGGAGPSEADVPDTLDEPVLRTLLRDVKMVLNKFLQVMMPWRRRVDVLQDWDMWGPLILCMTMAFLLRSNAKASEQEWVFTGTFVLVSVGAAVVTVNAQLLGGNITFFQSACVLGYCVLPLVLAALVNTLIPTTTPFWVYFVTAGIGLAWAVYAATGFLGKRH